VDRFTALARDLIPSSWLFALWQPPPPPPPEASGERRDARILPRETAEINTPEEDGSARIKRVFTSCQIPRPLRSPSFWRPPISPTLGKLKIF